MSQKEHSDANRAAWSHKAYEAWHRFQGTPREAVEEIREDPAHVLRHTLAYFGEVKDKKVANLLGSHGRRALALALLGAQVTVVDISEENQRYALEAAQALDVPLDYLVSDVLEWQTAPYTGHFDFVLMEFGILHYFVDLNPLANLIHTILKPAGKCILHEYHPLIKKCQPVQKGDRLVLEGDYFSREIFESPAAFHSAYSPEEAATFPMGRLRYWTLGEVVSALGTNGLMIETLVEHPWDIPALPGTFTLVAKRMERG